MGLTKEERAYFRLSIINGPPCLSEEEEAENLIEEIRQSIHESDSRRCGDTLGISALAGLALALVERARTVEEQKALHEKGRQRAGLHHEGQGEPLSPLSLYHFARYRGTRPRR